MKTKKPPILAKDAKRAIGLTYDSALGEAPKLSVKGDDLIAQKIINIASRYNVAVVEKPELVSALSSFEIDQEIPESLFEPVAVLLHELKRIYK